MIFVGAVLVINNAFQLYFVYRDARRGAASFQQEKAKAAAFKIERFVKGIEEQVRWTTQTPWAYDQRRGEYTKLLRNVPAIREISQLDFKAQEQIRAFRPSPGEIETRADYSKEPKAADIQRKPAQGPPTILTHFGEVYIREDGEPYMTLAMVSSELLDGVAVAEVNLKGVWELIFQASVGQAGYVYVADAKGRLVAHPDTSLVQKKTSFAQLEITVVFLDLRGFTAFAETNEPEEVMGVLREYHAQMGTLILEHEGTLEGFTGDGMMIFFNDPVLIENPAERAVRMAVAMRERVAEMLTKWTKRGYELGFGIGVAAGYATIGAIGFEGRWDYGAIGTNLAARLCGEAKRGQILISQRVWGAVEELVDSEKVGEVALKGFSRPVPAYNVLRLKG